MANPSRFVFVKPLLVLFFKIEAIVWEKPRVQCYLLLTIRCFATFVGRPTVIFLKISLGGIKCKVCGQKGSSMSLFFSRKTPTIIFCPFLGLQTQRGVARDENMLLCNLTLSGDEKASILAGLFSLMLRCHESWYPK